MSDQSSISSQEEEQPEESKIRISFILSPSISNKQRETLEIPRESIAVPSSIRKRGLSAIVNHLLDRKVISDDANNNSDDSDNDEDKLPAIPFDFLLNSKLLRLSLEAAIRKEGLSTEHSIELEYFPARLPPKKDGESDLLPDWINVMDYNHNGGVSGGNSSEGVGKGVLFTGGADGSIRSFQSKSGSSLQQICSVMAHTAPIKCLSTSPFLGNNQTLVATGSMDQTLITHLYNPTSSSTLDLHAVYTGGHTNSIGSVALSSNNNSVSGEGGNDKIIMASGDWDGGLAIWSIPTLSEVADNSNNNDDEENSSKKQKGIKGSKTSSQSNNTNIHEVKPLQSIKAHSTNISGISFTHNSSSPSTIITGSWDHSLKIYDINRMDNILTLNGSRVITSISRCCNSNVVATSNSDNTVRLWDMRTDGSGSSASNNGGGMDKSSLRTSHKGWVSNVCWSNDDPYILGSTSHDGTLKVWDIRSSLPLHTVKAVSKRGEKVLCLSFGENVIYSGGSDCVVKQFGL